MFHLLTTRGSKQSLNRWCVCSQCSQTNWASCVFLFYLPVRLCSHLKTHQLIKPIWLTVTWCQIRVSLTVVVWKGQTVPHHTLPRQGYRDRGGVKTLNLLEQSLESPTLLTFHWSHHDVLKKLWWAAQIFHVDHTEKETQLFPTHDVIDLKLNFHWFENKNVIFYFHYGLKYCACIYNQLFHVSREIN